MTIPKPELGHFMGEFPFIRFGDGPRTLVLFPPINDALQDVTNGARLRGWYYRNFADEYTVYFVSRKRGLPSGYTTRDMAADYARLFEQNIGPAHIVGLSLGGLIAQHFAADYPQYVESLVIGVAAHRLGVEGREIVRRWITLAREEQWRELYAEMIVAMYVGFRRPLYEILIRLMGNALVRNPAAASDFTVSAEASLSHDIMGRLETISARTLVIGGVQDKLFPQHHQSDTAQRIPNATLKVIKGTGHGAFDERKQEFDEAVKEFISH